MGRIAQRGGVRDDLGADAVEEAQALVTDRDRFHALALDWMS